MTLNFILSNSRVIRFLLFSLLLKVLTGQCWSRNSFRKPSIRSLIRVTRLPECTFDEVCQGVAKQILSIIVIVMFVVNKLFTFDELL